MASFFDYFNGSKYYKKRNQYRNELFNEAKKVIQNYKLQVPLYDETFIRPLTGKESMLLKQNRESTRESIKLIDGFCSASRVVFYDDTPWTLLPENYVQITKLGLKQYTDILAQTKARAETNYAIDLIDPAVLSGITVSYIAGIAISALPFMQAVGIGMQKAATYGLLAAIGGALLYIKELGDKYSIKALDYETQSQQVATSYASYSNYYMTHKKLQAGNDMFVYAGYAIYANGEIYKALTAGSESFKPTQAYNPTHNIAPLNKIENSDIDERTQGRSHYTLAGNDGYMDKLAFFPLEKIKELDNDIEYKQNFLKQHNQRLIEGYSHLASFLGSNEKYHSGEWMQAVYNADYRTYKDIYYDYVESKDFLNNMRAYNKALRFKGEFFSRSNNERKYIKISKKVDAPNITVSQSSVEQSPNDPIAIYEDLILQYFYEKRIKIGDLEEWLEENGEIDKTKSEWKQSQGEMLESISLEKYWNYLLALKAIDNNKVGDYVGKAIEEGYLESIVHNYFIAKNKMLKMSDYTLEEQDRFQIRPYIKNPSNIFVPYGIFSKIFCEPYLMPVYDDNSFYLLDSVYYQYKYESMSYKDIIQKVLNIYMVETTFLAKEFMQRSFKILCERQVG